MSRITAGPGDEETWGPCVGHPNDPRTEDSNVFEVNGVAYDFDEELSREDVAELLEAGQKACRRAGVDFEMVLEMAAEHLRGIFK